MRIIVCLAVTAALCLARAPRANWHAASSPANRLHAGARSWTDPAAYNLDDWSANPAGMLETQERLVSLRPGFRHASIDSHFSVNTFVLPSLTAGKPGVFMANLYYAASEIERPPIPGASLDLQRFGLRLAGQTERGLFQFGLQGRGFYGAVSSSRSGDERVVMGLERAGVSLGSQPHPLVRAAFRFGAGVLLDTLEPEYAPIEERFVALDFPLFGIDIDVGGEDFPVMANATVEWGARHFVYVVKPGSNGGDRDAVVTDTLAWRIQGLGAVGGDAFRLSPALFLDYWRAAGQIFAPGVDNHPLAYGEKREDHSWRFRSFAFGAGVGLDAWEWARAWCEYGRGSVRFEASRNLNAPPDQDRSRRGLNRVSLGAEALLDKIPALSLPDALEASPRVGFEHRQEIPRFGGVGQADYARLNSLGVGTQQFRYEPWRAMHVVNSFNITHLGLRLAAFESMIETVLTFGIIRGRGIDERGADSELRGLELRTDIAWNLRDTRP